MDLTYDLTRHQDTATLVATLEQAVGDELTLWTTDSDGHSTHPISGVLQHVSRPYMWRGGGDAVNARVAGHGRVALYGRVHVRPPKCRHCHRLARYDLMSDGELNRRCKSCTAAVALVLAH
ncbi:hypothetical protein ACQEVF_57690 [Nonomuraea polychroma]|uniref:hypothetical protein n=1 Tax=Nonomuraea polychroma TaxID=46176 RepID=UPI003D927BC5